MSSPASTATDPTPSPAPSNPPLPTKPPPPGFKWVKARKPDGTFITAKKRLTPEELEAQKKAEAASPTPAAPKTDTPSTNGTPAEPATPDAAVQYKVITARKPDGTLVKVKRPVKPGETVPTATTKKPGETVPTATTKKPAALAPSAAAPASSDSDAATKKETMSSDAPTAAPEPELSAADKELLREQALANKRHRRGRFGTALLVGLLGVAGSTLPDLMDGDEIMSDSDMDLSDDDDYDDDDDDDHHDPDDAHPNAENQKADSNEPSSGPNLAPVAAGVATAAVGAAAVAALTAPPPAKTANRQLNSDAQQPNGQDGADGKGKTAYKVTVKDLNDLDEKAERDAADRPLERRWAAVSFYLLASLSIILPLLFLILAIFITRMGGKTANSKWGMMVDPIKISVTVWPIVFAAVTAQGFKTWASYRVERGVKLMELEQLIGSNSFSAVMKQPILLRRLDLLTLGIFVIWALSPIGSQALLRTYSLGRPYREDIGPALYVPILGENMLLSPHATDKIAKTSDVAELWQIVSTFYISALLYPSPSRSATKNFFNQDAYNQPMPLLHSDIFHGYASIYGIPVALPPVSLDLDTEKTKAEKSKQAADAAAPSESFDFPITSSHFELTCGSWKQGTYATLISNNESWMSTSMSDTLGIEFFVDPDVNVTDPSDINLPVTSLRYASLNSGQKVLSHTKEWKPSVPQDDWKYTYIDCGFEQVFYTATVNCSIDALSGGYTWNCDAQNSVMLPPDQVKPEWRTVLRDFSHEMVSANSYPILDPYTPTEKFVAMSYLVNDLLPEPLNHTAVDPKAFAINFGTLFNTFIHLAHCVECVTVSNLWQINPGLAPEDIRSYYEPLNPRITSLYKPPTSPNGKAVHRLNDAQLIFKLDWRWVSVLLVSVIVLLVVGIASIILESFLIAPDVLGYASSLARNNRYLHLPKTAAKPMSGPERARTLGSVSVMIQDVKPDKAVGKIALGLHHDRAEKLKPGRLYR